LPVIVHTTPESRQALRSHLCNRRVTRSIHQTLTASTLNDQEDALRLLQGIRHPSAAWAEEIDVFLSRTLGSGPQVQHEVTLQQRD